MLKILSLKKFRYNVTETFFKDMRFTSSCYNLIYITCFSCYRSSFMLNATDSEVNSMSSEEIQALQEYDSLPPRPGTCI